MPPKTAQRDLPTTPLHPDTGNTCKHIGYDEFDPPSWNSECAPNKSDWIELDRYVCGTEGQYPEEFWACSDFSMSSGEIHSGRG